MEIVLGPTVSVYLELIIFSYFFQSSRSLWKSTQLPPQVDESVLVSEILERQLSSKHNNN